MADVPATALPDSPSEWITRWSHLLDTDATVLDVACGSGRHARWFAQRGHHVVAIDRTSFNLRLSPARVTFIQSDLERDAWPFNDKPDFAGFQAVVVTNYLWRPLFPSLLSSLAPGGVLLYETFAIGNATVGRPSRPEFLLQRGELLAQCADLQIVAYEDGFADKPARFIQRIAAVKPDTCQECSAMPKRFAL